ncbi:hypothetical protein TanjilG_18737 [Lupinus angustifolius]|uniref:BZIP domain-containing protein n=1 Tax=Lupinus angustifolius TaxID=3871 RepID=A0A1J7GMI3_LUPAN|nr:hypothetical protein TanjilG_18737 [Lupinus angustifolius]
MDDFRPSYGWNGGGWQQIPPGPSNINEINGSNSNVVPIGEGGVSNPFLGEVANDPVQRRRAANRHYSETYRRKKQEQVQHLEHLEKSLNGNLSDNTPQLGYHRGMESHYDAEASSLAQTYYTMNSNYQYVEGMDDFRPSYGWNGGGWQQIPPGPSNINEINGSNSNVIPIGEGGVSNHFLGDVAYDPVQRRRVANRQYSEAYRRKKQEQVQHLEHLEKEVSLLTLHNLDITGVWNLTMMLKEVLWLKHIIP